MLKNSLDDTIVALSTPVGEGGIGIVRISGDRALKIADKIFSSKDGRKPSTYDTYTVHYGHVADKDVIDEAILTVMKAPRSYTKEDIVEINCHGGIQALKKTLELAVKCGARLAEPGEFTKRAFLNGRIDLTQAEAVLDVIRAKTEGSLKVAIGQLEGRLSKDVSAILDELIGIASEIEASIDFPEEGIEPSEKNKLSQRTAAVAGKIRGLVDSFAEGVVMREGVLAVICGKPNVGKSSLMNLLLKRDRVIVAPVPGTTRDAVEETINLGGVPIRLVDTAGIGEVDDVLYKKSSDKSKHYIERSDLALLMLDASANIGEEDLDLIRLVEEKKKVVVLNKIDLGRKIEKKNLSSLFKKEPVVELSVEKKKNIELLEKSILDIIWSGRFTQGESSIVTNLRHKELLDKALANVLAAAEYIKHDEHPELISVELKDAMFNVGLIIGKSVSNEVLDRIFENFCIGK